MKKIDLIIHNVRSAHNVGSILRTADGLGINKVHLTGYSPYPEADNDVRLPHERLKISKLIHKTALGAENSVNWRHEDDIKKVITELNDSGYQIISLEQTSNSIPISKFKPPAKMALIVGNEITGIDESVLNASDNEIHIPMHGKKESFNVAIAAAIALYYLCNA